MTKPALRKELGQHHLSSGALVRPLLEFLGLARSAVSGTRGRVPAPGRRVFEIGPGGGVLTAELLKSGASVMAMELDPSWAFELRRRMEALTDGQDLASSQVVIGDALMVDWSRFDPEWMVAGNLPYGVATAILRAALQDGRAGLRLAFLVQHEVAQRICARPGERQYGALSVLVRARTGAKAETARLLAKVKPGSFVPPPKVDSAFVGLKLESSVVPRSAWSSFTDVVFAGFAQRRKTVRNSLCSRFSQGRVAAALERAGVDPRDRAEQIDVDAWFKIWRSLA